MKVDVEKRLSVATNAAAWALYADDGRDVVADIEGTPQIGCSEEETAVARRVAERVLEQIDGYERQCSRRGS